MDQESGESLDELVAARLDAYQLLLADAATERAEEQTDCTLPDAIRKRVASGKQCIDLLNSLKPRREASMEDRQGSTPGPRHIGPFEIFEELGSGGFGIVYRARDPRTDREVAVKIPRIEVLASPDLQRRFEQEARAAAKLDHPYIVPVLEAGSDGLLPYIASAYCHGVTLSRWLAEQTRNLPPRLCAELIEKLALAMSHAHERGVLHRDLKPGNVILAGANPLTEVQDAPLPVALIPRLTDFGLARMADQAGDQTKSGALLGTPAYMAPEQAIGRSSDVGPGTDVYGLGTMLYEMLIGRPPLRGLNDADTIRQVCFEEPVPPRRLRRDIPRDLEAICLHCLEKKPSDRYTSAQALADDLRRFLDGLPTLVRPLSPPQLLWRLARRKPAWATVVLLLVAATAAIAAIFARSHYEQLQLNQELREQRAEAETHARHASELAYSADMQLASKAWEKNNILELHTILDRYKSHAGQADLRGDEWYYLRGQLQEDSRVIADYGKAAHDVRFSPDGSLLAVSCKDGALRVYDMPSAKLKWTITQNKFALNGLSFSPDGKVLAAGNDFAHALIFDMTTGTALRTLKGGHLKWVAAVDFSPDGEWLASAGADGYVAVWNWRTGEKKQRFAAQKGELRGIRFTRDGQHVVTNVQIGPLQIWNLETQTAVATVQAPHPTDHGEDWVRGIALSADRTLLAAAWAQAGGLVVYDISNVVEPKVIGGIPAEHSNMPCFITNQRLAVGAVNNTGHIWNLNEPTFNRHLRGHRDKILGVHATPDGTRLVTCSLDGSVRLWLSDSMQQGTVVAELPERLMRFVISPRGDELAIGRHNPPRVTIVHLPSGQHETDQYSGHRTPNVAYIRGGARLIVGHGTEIEALARPSGERVWRWERPAVDSAPEDIGIDNLVVNDGLAVALDTKRLWAVRLIDGKLVWRKEFSEGVFPLACSHDGKCIYVGDHGGKIHELQAGDGTTNRVLKLHVGSIIQIAVSPDDRLVASASRDRVIRLWDRQSGNVIRNLDSPEENVGTMQISPDGQTLVGAQDEYYLSFWRLVTGQRVVQAGPWGREYRFLWEWSPDRRTIYMATYVDGTTTIRSLLYKAE